MKKFISISIAAIMMIALASVFVFADDKNSTTIATEENVIAIIDGETFSEPWVVREEGDFIICVGGGYQPCP